MDMARCGLDCDACEYRESTHCPGCRALADGRPFWGECRVALCALGKGYGTCVECPVMPCDTLTAFSYDAEQGDNGQRIENLRRSCGL